MRAASINRGSTGGEGPGEYDHGRCADSGAEPQRRERNPCDRGDETQGFEDRRQNVVEQTEPPHHQAERDAEQRREANAEGVAVETRREMLWQRCAGEGAFISWMKRIATSSGAGRNCRGTKPVTDNAIQMPRNTASPARPKPSLSRIDNGRLFMTRFS
jgi:hypothetical protein